MAKRSASQPSESENPENVAPVVGEGEAPQESTEGSTEQQEGTEASSPVTEPTEDDKKDESVSPADDSDEKSDGSDSDDEDDLPDPNDENYNPYQDPSVGSSSLADIVVVELKNGESPTLNACREAYREAKK